MVSLFSLFWSCGGQIGFSGVKDPMNAPRDSGETDTGPSEEVTEVDETVGDGVSDDSLLQGDDASDSSWESFPDLMEDLTDDSHRDEQPLPDPLTDSSSTDLSDWTDDWGLDGDSETETPQPPCPGGMGCLCSGPEDCDSEFCAETTAGRVCTPRCSDDSSCPEGMKCGEVMFNNGTVKGCVDPFARLCRPCRADEECRPQGGSLPEEGYQCIEYGSDGWFCGVSCQQDVDCPSGFRCVTTQSDEGTRHCVIREGANCPCPESFKGVFTTCHVANVHGTCYGERTCDSECSASSPQAESCNGIDDDCDGLTDEGEADFDQDGIGDDCDPDRDGDGDPDVTDCEPSNPYISTNAKESCNGYDDDCDGLVDEEGSIDCLLYFSDQDADGYGSNVDFLCLCGPYGVYSTRFSGDCADQDSTRHPGLPEICDGRDNNCDDVADESPCPQPMIVIPGSASSGPPIQNPIGTGICAVFGTFPGGPNTNDERNLPAFMALLDGMNGASSSAISSVPQLNFGHFPNTGAYYTGDYPGADTVPVAGSGALAARFRGFLVISEPVVWTMELTGSDAVKLIIAGNVAALLSWANRGWKYSVGVRFESAGIYPIEIQWSTNQLSANAYDVLELGYAWGVQSGDNGVMHCAPQVLQCSWKPSAAYQLVPSSLLIASSDGQPVDCQPCDSDEQCAPGHVCNAAGICQAVL